MLKKKISLLGFISLAVIALTAVNTEGSQPIPRQLFVHSFGPIEVPVTSGEVEFRLTFYPKTRRNPEGNPSSVTLVTTDGLQVIGDTAWTVNTHENKPFDSTVRFVIPENDTSSISVVLRCGTLYSKINWYFVTTGDTVECWRGNPRGHIEFPIKPRTGPRRGWHVPGQFPELDSLYGLPIPPFEIGHKYETYILSKEEITRSKMRKLERKPLSGIGAQVFFIDGKVWMRKRGETKFYETEPITETDEYALLQAGSTGGISGDAKKDVCLIISTQEQLEQAEKLLGTLEPTEEKGYYHQVVKWDDLRKLDSAGIKIIFIDLVPHEHGQHEQKGGSPDLDDPTEGYNSHSLSNEKEFRCQLRLISKL